MNRKSVNSRKAIVLIFGKNEQSLFVDEDGTIIVFENRNNAKKFIESNKQDLIKEYGIDATYRISLLDWDINFEQPDVKIVIN